MTCTGARRPWRVCPFLPKQRVCVSQQVDVEANDTLASSLGCRKLPTTFFVGPHRGKPAVRMQVRDVATGHGGRGP